MKHLYTLFLTTPMLASTAVAEIITVSLSEPADYSSIQEAIHDASNGDIDGNGFVGVDEILLIIANWGTADSPADVNSDGLVSADDILFVLSHWGECP